MKKSSSLRKSVKAKKQSTSSLLNSTQVVNEVSQRLTPNNNEATESILSIVTMLWILGEWDKLIGFQLEDYCNDIDRKHIALFIASAHLHKANTQRAKELIQYALRLGCTPEAVAKVLIADVHNSFGCIEALKQNEEAAASHFRLSVDISEYSQVTVSQARALKEVSELGLAEQATYYIQAESTSQKPNELVNQKMLAQDAIALAENDKTNNIQNEINESKQTIEQTLQELYTQAKQAYQQSEWLKSMNLWTEVKQFCEQNQLDEPKELDKSLETSRLKYAIQCRKDQNYQTAKEILAAILELNPQHQIALKEYAKNHAAEQNWAESLNIWQKIIASKTPEIVDDLISKSLAYKNLDLLKKAIETLENACQLGIENTALLFQLAMFYRDSGEWGKAEKIVNDILINDSEYIKNANFAYFCSRIFWQSNQPQKAKKLLLKMMKLNNFTVEDLPLNLQFSWNEIENRLSKG